MEKKIVKSQQSKFEPQDLTKKYIIVQKIKKQKNREKLIFLSRPDMKKKSMLRAFARTQDKNFAR